MSARTAVASAALAAVLATVLVVLVVAIDRQRDAARAARGSEAALTEINALRVSLLDLETGLRGFVISGQERSLESFQRARGALPDENRRLERAVGDRGDQRVLAARIAAGLRAYLTQYAAPLLTRARRTPAAARAEVTGSTGRGRVDTLRALFARITAARIRVADALRERADAQASRALTVGAAGLGASVILIALFALYLARAVAALGARRAELAATVDRLEAEKARIARYGVFGRRIATQTEREELARTIAVELAELCGARAAVLYAAEEDAWPTVLAAVGIEDPPPELPGTGRAARALAEREPAALAPGEPDRLLSGDGAELAVPLVHAGATVGLVLLGWAGERPHDGTEDELEDLIPPAAATLSNVIALTSTRRRASVIRAVLDSTPDAIALLDSEGQTVLENPPMKEVRGALVESVRAPGGGHRINVSVQGSDPRAEVRDELELLGTGRTFARYAAPVRDDSGGLVGRLVLLREVTGDRAAERLKDEFFALVSHELRTPLTSVLGYLELVLDDEEPLAEEHRHYLEIVERNATRLLRLVGDLLFVAQVEAGTLALHPGPVDLAAVTGEAVEAARPKAESRSIALSAEIGDVGPVWGDRDRLGQVLDNLVANALKFTPTDGEVVVRLVGEDGRAVLEVEDTGPGIAAEEQGRLFERFFRSDSAVRQAVPGVGLGLTIVKAIAEAHGGVVEVDSATGEGTTFRVELPARPGP